MALLNLKPESFEELVGIFLFDMTMNQDQIKNKNFKDFIDENGSKIKPSLIKFYLDSNSDSRLNYKRIKGIFDGSSDIMQQIKITSSKEEDNKKDKKKGGLVKKIIKKILKKESLNIKEEKILLEYINNT